MSIIGKQAESTMVEAEPDAIYEIELCNGERRRWRYCGAVSQSQIWWRDMETGREFNETSVMYAWTIIRKEEPSTKPGTEERS
ncbi:MAG: domain S-box [Proteobacteria bacterium]|nr:domain S-box [Pseudomonadota bacterium]